MDNALFKNTGLHYQPDLIDLHADEPASILADELDSADVPHQGNSETDIETERVAFRNFQLLKALKLNVRQGGYTTGWIGFLGCGILVACGRSAVSDEEIEAELVDTGASIGFEITAMLGRLGGLLTAPARMTEVYVTRKLLYTQSQTKAVCQALSNLRPDLQNYDLDTFLKTEGVRTFQAKVKSIIQIYGKSGFSTSDSSSELMNELESTELLDTIAEKIISYLSEEESPMKLLSWQAEKYSKNQGKRLFNTIMQTFVNN